MLCERATISKSIFFIKLNAKIQEICLQIRQRNNKKTAAKNAENAKNLSTSGHALQFFYGGNHLRYYLKCIPNYSIVCCFKEGRFRILIDDYNYFTAIHACKMLNGSGNSNSNIQIRRNSKAGLSNVFMMRSPAGV